MEVIYETDFSLDFNHVPYLYSYSLSPDLKDHVIPTESAHW